MKETNKTEQNSACQAERSTLTGLAVLCRREAHLTLAAITPRSVQTLAVLTQVDVVCTLVHV